MRWCSFCAIDDVDGSAWCTLCGGPLRPATAQGERLLMVQGFSGEGEAARTQRKLERHGIPTILDPFSTLQRAGHLAPCVRVFVPEKMLADAQRVMAGTEARAEKLPAERPPSSRSAFPYLRWLLLLPPVWLLFVALTSR